MISLSEQDGDVRTAVSLIASEIEALLSGKKGLSQREIFEVKLRYCRLLRLSRVPSNSAILNAINPEKRMLIEPLLRRKRARTRSGISVITVMTKPFECPHGTCIFCPGGVRLGTPQSYTKNSPAASFGASRGFDPKRQIEDQLEILRRNGHDTSKVELIILGGTVLAMPCDYQEDFVRKSYEALNCSASESLFDAIKSNERASHRCVGFTIETKPDWCREEHIDRLLSYAATRVEIGVQSLQDDVLKFTNRGHNLQDTIKAFRVAKDSGFKIVAHMMPGLPLSDQEKDLSDLLRLIEDPELRPDMLKIYPTLVIEGTALHRMMKMGKYSPYNLETTIDLLCKFKRHVPEWIRIMRIQREIPKDEISRGPSSGNLRQLVLLEMRRRGERCRCIRCREVGHLSENDQIDYDNLRTKRIDYESSGGREVFISKEDPRTDTLLGFLRLRIPSGNEHRPEIRGKMASIVRELHVYGPVVPLGERGRSVTQSQHRGLGTELLAEAERISREEFHIRKQLVISASGTKEYYRKRGYSDDGAYVSKLL